MEFQMLRNEPVDVKLRYNEKNHPVAVVDINGKVEHVFPATSRVSKALDIMTPDDLASRLSGGQFFVIGDELVDFRDGHYNGFVQPDEDIKHLMDVIGCSERTKGVRVPGENISASHLTLSNVWDKNNIVVPGYREGGEFHSMMRFKWNPFSNVINGVFQLVRLICSNGMTGLTSMFNTRIPLINRWEEHLDIASRQLQNKVENITVRRIQDMSRQMATVSELAGLAEHASERLSSSTVVGAEQEQLHNILKAVSPRIHLGNIYSDSVFANKALGNQLPGHLTMFDAYNIATEMATHTHPTSNSTNHALDKIANWLMFTRLTDVRNHQVRTSDNVRSSFSNPDQAFFGQLH